MSFIERNLKLVFIKTSGTFVASDSNQMTVTGLRVQCNIINCGGVTMGEAQLRVYGLTKAHIEDLSALNSGFMVQRAIRLDIHASDDNGGFNLIFSGQIMLSQIDLNNAPESALIIMARAGLLQVVQPTTPTSYPSRVSHLTVLADLAKSAGLDFEPNGMPVMFDSLYLYGSSREQMLRCADAAGANISIELNKLIVWPRLGIRGNTGTVPLVSPATGLVGYPTYSDMGIAIKTLFNPFIRLAQLVTVESSLSFANGSWGAYYVRHELESQTPNGKWFTHFNGAPYTGGL